MQLVDFLKFVLQRLELARSTSNRVAEICTLCNLGNCLRATGKLQEAIENYTLVRVIEHSLTATYMMVFLLNVTVGTGVVPS